ncbi:MAG: DnaJ domain-containing protein [Candidatus Omnitrophica bacterium]|nr:DnaJ domain-containing protein [Candidatus Omnitrophota bacterium]
MADFKQIERARKALNLAEEATLQEITQAYRKLRLKYDPDRCRKQDRDKCEQLTKEINRAKDLLMAYCQGYRYSFKEKDVKRNSLDKETYAHLKRFYDGWWGNLDL